MKKLRWTWDNFEEVLLCIIITVITLVSGLQVVCRYLFNNSLTWSEEVSRYLFVDGLSHTESFHQVPLHHLH